jgi:hypothetical protein
MRPSACNRELLVFWAVLRGELDVRLEVPPVDALLVGFKGLKPVVPLHANVWFDPSGKANVTEVAKPAELSKPDPTTVIEVPPRADPLGSLSALSTGPTFAV